MIFPEFNDHATGLPQPDMSDMLPNTASARYKVANNKFYLDQRPKGYDKRTPLMMRPTITDITMKVKPCRDSINDVVRRAKVDGGKSKLLGARPQTGTGRHEPAGLESLPQHAPGTIMPLPDYFYPSMNTTIPMLA